MLLGSTMYINRLSMWLNKVNKGSTAKIRYQLRIFAILLHTFITYLHKPENAVDDLCPHSLIKYLFADGVTARDNCTHCPAEQYGHL